MGPAEMVGDRWRIWSEKECAEISKEGKLAKGDESIRTFTFIQEASRIRNRAVENAICAMISRIRSCK